MARWDDLLCSSLSAPYLVDDGADVLVVDAPDIHSPSMGGCIRGLGCFGGRRCGVGCGAASET